MSVANEFTELDLSDIMDPDRKSTNIEELPKYNALFYLLWDRYKEQLFVPEVMTISREEYLRITEMTVIARTTEEKPPQELSDYNVMCLAMLALAAKHGFIADDQLIADYKERTLPRIQYELELEEVHKKINETKDQKELDELKKQATELNKKIDATDKTEEDLLEEFLRDVQIPPTEMLDELNRRQENYSIQVGTNDAWKVKNEETIMLALRLHFEVKDEHGNMDIKETDKKIIEAMPKLKSIPISDADWENIQKEIQEDLKLKKELLKQLIQLRKKEKEKSRKEIQDKTIEDDSEED